MPAINLYQRDQAFELTPPIPVKSRIENGKGYWDDIPGSVEELLWKLRRQYTIIIVTHNMAQARRASEESVFMLMGKVVEHSETAEMFVTPMKKETADYIEGRYG